MKKLQLIYNSQADVLALCKCHITLSEGLEYLWILISRGTLNHALRYRKLQRECVRKSMTISIRVTMAVKTQRECKVVAGCSGLELPKAQGDARLEYRVAQSSEGSCWGTEAALWGTGPSYRAEPGLSTVPRHRVQERAGKDAGPSNRSSSS